MATIAKTSTVYPEGKLATAAGSTWLTRFMDEAKFNYYFLISFVITSGSCLGGVTAMYILSNDAPIWQLCINIYVTMASNVACIAQAPAKWVVRIFALSLLANIVLLLANVL